MKAGGPNQALDWATLRALLKKFSSPKKAQLMKHEIWDEIDESNVRGLEGLI